MKDWMYGERVSKDGHERKKPKQTKLYGSPQEQPWRTFVGRVLGKRKTHGHAVIQALYGVDQSGEMMMMSVMTVPFSDIHIGLAHVVYVYDSSNCHDLLVMGVELRHCVCIYIHMNASRRWLWRRYEKRPCRLSTTHLGHRRCILSLQPALSPTPSRGDCEYHRRSKARGALLLLYSQEQILSCG